MPTSARSIAGLVVLATVCAAAVWTVHSSPHTANASIGPQVEALDLQWIGPPNARILEVRGVPKSTVQVAFRARLGELEYEWAATAEKVPGENVIRLPLDVPPQAWLHPTAENYVTALIARVHGRGGNARAADTYLAWPDGPDSDPVVWTVPEQRQLAANGVLDPALRDGLGPEVFLMPNTGPGHRTRER